MPNLEQLQRAAERREARKAAQQEAVAKANAQDQQQIGAAAGETKAMDAAEVVRQKVRPATKEERKRMQQEAVAAALRAQDIRPTPNVLDGYEHVPGVVPPLHIQNALARVASGEIKDEARELAQLVGKQVYDAALDPGGRGQHNRWKKLRKAADLQRANQSAQK